MSFESRRVHGTRTQVRERYFGKKYHLEKNCFMKQIASLGIE